MTQTGTGKKTKKSSVMIHTTMSISHGLGCHDITNQSFAAWRITPSPHAMHYSRSFFNYEKWMIIKKSF
jgi:hypothetical protein